MPATARSATARETTHCLLPCDCYCVTLVARRGYEWWVVQEARRRNPTIATYGLTWGVPGWIGNGSFYSADNIKYHVDWVTCAKNAWNFTVDWMGIWNERAPDNTWIKELRQALDGAGYSSTRLVAADTDWWVSSRAVRRARGGWRGGAPRAVCVRRCTHARTHARHTRTPAHLTRNPRLRPHPVLAGASWRTC